MCSCTWYSNTLHSEAEEEKQNRPVEFDFTAVGDGRKLSHRPPKITKYSQQQSYSRMLTALALSSAGMVPYIGQHRQRSLSPLNYYMYDLVATSVVNYQVIFNINSAILTF